MHASTSGHLLILRAHHACTYASLDAVDVALLRGCPTKQLDCNSTQGNSPSHDAAAGCVCSGYIIVMMWPSWLRG